MVFPAAGLPSRWARNREVQNKWDGRPGAPGLALSRPGLARSRNCSHPGLERRETWAPCVCPRGIRRATSAQLFSG